jgi:hypothetical protein
MLQESEDISIMTRIPINLKQDLWIEIYVLIIPKCTAHMIYDQY